MRASRLRLLRSVSGGLPRLRVYTFCMCEPTRDLTPIPKTWSHPRCVSSKYKFSNDDDVDDEYTEKGRQLVAREREAVAKGFALGQVLTAAFFDLDFPDIVGGPRSEWQGVEGLQQVECRRSSEWQGVLVMRCGMWAETARRRATGKRYNTEVADSQIVRT